ncbi:hypothetical protein LL037_20365 [Clostridium estertheticum]|uniref:hypothetical protein n=1 Tax=Clostridium estertheticum TaxID=238834 RepID=UPI001C0E88D0|nr:hypothetical protein [Clostridium estertheticum]MBU3202098.1 hypothetical protein [Clostridium estertheticum]WAG64794.1 hypothetical protein LL037_20365 [Clostridium estertheticum]
MSFILCNNNSIKLNFILYVFEYKKKLDFKNEFLDMKELWNNMIRSIITIPGRGCNNSFVFWDIDFLKEKDSYKVLFENTEDGYNEFSNVWDKYINWWYDEGLSMFDKKAEEVIPIIYDLVMNRLVAEKLEPPSDTFAIQIMFDKIPNGWLSSGTLCTIESINNFSDKYKVNEVCERLYRLILSKY